MFVFSSRKDTLCNVERQKLLLFEEKNFPPKKFF